MVKLEGRRGCCKYCSRADVCMLSYIYSLSEATLEKEHPELPESVASDIYEAVEKALYSHGIQCTAFTDCCPECKKHEDSGCYGDED